MRVAVAIELTKEERTVLTKWSRDRSTPVRVVLRAKIVLAAAEGMLNKEIAVRLDDGRQAMATGKGTKRSIEQAAAQALLDQIEGST